MIPHAGRISHLECGQRERGLWASYEQGRGLVSMDVTGVWPILSTPKLFTRHAFTNPEICSSAPYCNCRTRLSFSPLVTPSSPKRFLDPPRCTNDPEKPSRRRLGQYAEDEVFLFWDRHVVAASSRRVQSWASMPSTCQLPQLSQAEKP